MAGAIRPEQLQRAHDLGVTCSLFVDQIRYWGDVEEIADLEVGATLLAGRQVYGANL
jgi:predicted amidohydrolase YtcJ